MTVDCSRLTILFLAAADMCLAQQTSDFGGTWVFKFNDQAIFKLVLTSDNGNFTGLLTRPRHLTIDQDGDVTKMTPEEVTLQIGKAASNAGRLELTIFDDHFVMTLKDHNEAILETEGVRPWHLERGPDGNIVTLAKRLTEPQYPAEIRAVRQRLRGMVREDQNARLAFNLKRADAVDAKNRAEVLRIFSRYGWVTNSLAGKDAAHDFWLLVEHQTPEIQRRLLPALEKAAKDGNASMSDYAYLYDRVQMGLGKPQHWGAAGKCEEGKPVLYPVDDPAGLDARRKELYLMPVRDYLQMDYIVKSCAQAGK
jgi:hypothetical protein